MVKQNFMNFHERKINSVIKVKKSAKYYIESSQGETDYVAVIREILMAEYILIYLLYYLVLSLAVPHLGRDNQMLDIIYFYSQLASSFHSLSSFSLQSPFSEQFKKYKYCTKRNILPLLSISGKVIYPSK